MERWREWCLGCLLFDLLLLRLFVVMMDDMDEGNWTFRGVIRFDGLLVWFAHFTLFGFLLDNILVFLGMFKTAYILLFGVLCFVDTGLYCC